MNRHRSGDAVLGDIDLLTKILLRLPVKDVLRSKCVCKTWRYLVCEPKFCYWHTLELCRKHKHNPNLYPSGILRQTYDCRLLKRAQLTPFNTNSNSRFIRLDVHNKLDRLVYYEIQQSSNGLLLWDSFPVRVFLSPYDAETKELYQGCNYFYVTNPSTGHCVRIDHFGYQSHPNFSKPYLVFEPWKSPHYKIIFFAKVIGDRNNELTTKMKMSVYSSETGSWSKVDLVPSFPNNVSYFGSGIYCNGAIHWYPLGNLLVYFDIDQLCLKNLPTLPFPPHLLLKLVYFGECGGKLYLIMKKYNEKLRYDIWELKEDYSGWITRYYVDLTTLQANSFDVEVLCIVRQPPNEDEEEESMFAILVVDIKRLVSYNLKDHSSRILCQSDGFYRSYFCYQYFETLASISLGYNNV